MNPLIRLCFWMFSLICYIYAIAASRYDRDAIILMAVGQMAFMISFALNYEKKG